MNLAVFPFSPGQLRIDLRASLKADPDAANIRADDAEFDVHRCADEERPLDRELCGCARLGGSVPEALALLISQAGRPSQARINAYRGGKFRDEVRLDLDIDDAADRNDDRNKGQRDFIEGELVFQLALDFHLVLLRKTDVRIRARDIVL